MARARALKASSPGGRGANGPAALITSAKAVSARTMWADTEFGRRAGRFAPGTTEAGRDGLTGGTLPVAAPPRRRGPAGGGVPRGRRDASTRGRQRGAGGKPVWMELLQPGNRLTAQERSNVPAKSGRELEAVATGAGVDNDARGHLADDRLPVRADVVQAGP